MIWLTWRQFRTQAVVTIAALAALAIYLVILGYQIRHAYTTDVVGCQPADCSAARRDFQEAFETQVGLVGALLLGVPGLIGVFWGAPLITREFEAKTDRMVWNQSITRTRWFAVKLSVLTLLSMAVTGLLSLLLTWSASRYDQQVGGRFDAMTFAARNVVPIGYAAFAFVAGAVIGLLIRRTLPAMAATLALFAVIQILVPTALRQHLMTPVTSTVTVDVDALDRADFVGMNDTEARIGGYTMPGAWSLTTMSQIFNADGTPYTVKQAEVCRKSEFKAMKECTAGQNLHFSYTYQPANRYWPFQWIELSGFLVLTLLLAGFGFWRIRRHTG